jgi:hypothetical protein
MAILESHPASAPPTAPHDRDHVAMLLAFVRDRDVNCPRCDYNLRNLTQPVCPECREALALKVGVQRIVLAWLLATLAPGIFCGIAVGVFFIMSLLHGFPRR